MKASRPGPRDAKAVTVAHMGHWPREPATGLQLGRHGASVRDRIAWAGKDRREGQEGQRAAKPSPLPTASLCPDTVQSVASQ